MVEVSNNFKQECEANVGAYKFGKIKVNYINDNPLNYEQGEYSSSNGEKIENDQRIRYVNLVECKPSFKYKIELGNSAYKMKIITYTDAQAFIATHDNLVDGSEVTTEATAKYLSVTIYSTDVLEGTSILLNGTSRNGALTGAELEGNTTQNGTPTPTTPIEVNNVTGLQEVKICGRNLLPTDTSEWESGHYATNGQKQAYATRMRLKNLLPVSPNTTYWVGDVYTKYFIIREYNSNEVFVNSLGGVYGNRTFTTGANTYFLGLAYDIAYDTYVVDTYKLFMCLSTQTNKTFEPYKVKEYNIDLGGKNIGKIPAWTSDTKNGITATFDEETQTFTFNGTCTTDNTTFWLLNGGYTFNCTANITTLSAHYVGGSASGYATIQFQSQDYTKSLMTSVLTLSDTNKVVSSTTGNDFISRWNTIRFNNGTILDNFSFKVMVANSTDTTYSPYTTDIIELNKIGTYQDFIRKGSGKNLLSSDLETRTHNGLTITRNSDGTYKINGTATADVSLAINNDFIPMKGTWRMSGCPSGGSASTYMLSAYVGYWGGGSPNIDTGNGTSITYTGNVKVRFYIKNGTTCNNLLFKPMVTYDLTETSYEPYGYKGKWYIEKNIDRYDFTSSTTYAVNGNWNTSYPTILHIFTREIENKWKIGQSGFLSNRFICTTEAQRDFSAEMINCHTTNGTPYIFISYDRLSGVTSSSTQEQKINAFKTWISSNPTSLYYILAHTTYTLIENEELLNQLEELSNANTQEGITNILVSGNLPATLEVERDLTDSIKGRQVSPYIGYNITGDDDLISFKITGKADSSKSFIGSCVTKQIDLEIFNEANRHNLENKQIIVSTGMAETTGNYVTFEPFTITGTKDNKTKDKASYVGYDDMYRLNTAYTDTNTYGESGITLYSFLESLANNLNTTLGNDSIPNGDFIVDGNPFTNNETNMFALSQVAKLSGGFAEIGRDNKIYIKTLDHESQTPAMIFDTNLYTDDFEKSEKFGAVNKVVVGESNISGNEAIVSDLEDIELNGEHVVEILDSYFLSDDTDKQTICAELFDNLEGLYYSPFSATCNGFPYLDLGDMISIKDKNNNTYLSYLLNFELAYNGGYKEKIGAEAQSSTETKYKNVNTLKDKFKQVEILVDKANAQIQSVIKTSDDNYTEITQTIGGITTEVSNATTTAGNALTAVGALAQGTQQQYSDLTEALSRLSQSVNNIQALFRVTGGANLIQNSVGFFQNSSGAPTMWNVSQGIAGFKHGYDSELLGLTTSQGKFYVRNGTISTTEDDVTLETEANISGIEIGSLVTLSFKYKQSADSTTTITLTNGETTFFTATFSEEVEDWTSYSDENNTNSFTCTTDSLVLTITNTSTYNTDDQGFMISDLILNYGEEKTWELHSGESYGGVIQLSSQGISVKSSSANTITYMTSDGIEVFETTQGDVLGDLITKLTSNGIETKDFVATGDITTRNLITTMIRDTSNNDIYIEYIKDE